MKAARKKQRKAGKSKVPNDSLRPAQQPQRKRESPIQFSVSMICTLVVALFILTFNVQAFEIPTSSMEHTLLVGDHVLVDRADVGTQTEWMPLLPHHTIKQGDILVFLSPAEPGRHLVKRVIGVPGDHIRLNAGVLIRNGNVVTESYVVRNGSYVPYRDNFPDVAPAEADGLTPQWQSALSSHVQDGELIVPTGNYFAMGDNRDVSYDSRYWGFVPQESIIGRPLIIYWSFEQPPDEYLKTNPSERLAYMSRVVLPFFRSDEVESDIQTRALRNCRSRILFRNSSGTTIAGMFCALALPPARWWAGKLFTMQKLSMCANSRTT